MATAVLRWLLRGIPNSGKVVYKCLWPGCGKVLRSSVGIKRHVRTQHLGDGADSEQRRREEDFYYTEMQVKEEPEPHPLVPQALPSIQIPVSPHIFTSISWATATSTLPSLSPVRSRSLSFSEPQPGTPLLKSHLIVASPPRVSLGSRKVRGEAKKCRKVYGIEHRDQWCTACRWKKACQRFLD
ncbi:PREDICTED: zinc finger protein 395 [Tinamus guttatus]|uniref:zinc finger protein 395 n=1 Tax=Tinamus guttatus TaxID=94827 RepID=UPI00052EC7CB|nr:PREDICTED: zinc finger protein 395 [Tinamus guttatus]